jgi:prepilin-type N-terminal cleavage/methylation domain-containing protein
VVVAGASRRRGFTLIELLLTLSVIVAIGAIALPGLFDILAERQLVRGGNGVRIAMVQARLEAMRTGRTQMMRFQTGGPQFKVEPFVTAGDVTESADMLGQGTSVAVGGVATAAAPNMAVINPATATAVSAADRDPMDPRMDNEYLPGEVVFGVAQVQATARSATLQQQGATLNPSMGSASAAPDSGGQWSEPVMFYPDGTTSNAVVSVTLENIGQVLVKIRGLTGETDVTEVVGL